MLLGILGLRGKMHGIWRRFGSEINRHKAKPEEREKSKPPAGYSFSTGKGQLKYASRWK